MATDKGATHACTDCGFSSPKWFGKCPDCGSWSTATLARGQGEDDALVITSLSAPATLTARTSTSIAEMDRVLGGGLVPGQVLLLAGEPGIGKSTLVLQLLDGVRRTGGRTLLVSGEESIDQVSRRARRLGLDPDLPAAAGVSLAPIIAASEGSKPALLVIDSIQTLADPGLETSPGSPTQVRHCAGALIQHAKARGTIVVLVGHVTKDGAVAGPKVLEHLVDTVLTLDGERDGSVRLLRAAKNRFGSCEELGVFEMSATGLQEVADPSALLLADRAQGVAGSIVFPGSEGSRPLLMEIQALVAPTNAPQVRRVGIGIDTRRLALSVGVLSQRFGLSLGDRDVFAAAAGGLSVREPASDLPLALAIYSAIEDVPIPPGVVAFGEVGLGGEVRRVPGFERRLTEASRLGFEFALVPRGGDPRARGITTIEVADVAAAFASLSRPDEVGKGRVVSLSNA